MAVPKLPLSDENATVTAPDGTELAGLPAQAADALKVLWSGDADPDRLSELGVWETKVRLAYRLDQAAVPAPPVCRNEVEAKLKNRAAVARQGVTLDEGKGKCGGKGKGKEGKEGKE
eukprot:Hpha_TRINITY_DN30497_c0_g1::TRINITY_DN30497_c0_g1_i1::g.168041::m.168041